MYVVEPRKDSEGRHHLKVPNYDVKIIAGQRVVVYHENDEGRDEGELVLHGVSANGLQDQTQLLDVASVNQGRRKSNSNNKTAESALNKDKKVEPPLNKDNGREVAER